MKKILISFGLLLIIILAFTYHYSKLDYGVKEFENTFNQTLPNGIASEKLYDSYSGVPYEGEWLYSFSFPEESAAKFISEMESSDFWHPLPLSESLSLIMHGGSKNDIEYIHFFADRVGLPEVTNGYWKLVDENSNSNFLESSSFDFSLAIFDADNNIMYFFKINT